MPRPKAVASSLSELIDSPVASSDADVPVDDSNQENTTPPKRGRGRAKAASARKTKPVSKRLSGGKAKTTAKRVAKRAPLKDKTNSKQANEAGEGGNQEEEAQEPPQEDGNVVDDQTEVQEPVKAKRKGRPRKVKEQAAEKPSSQPQTTIVDDEFEYTPSTTRNARKALAVISTIETTDNNVVPETQMELDEATEDDDLGALPESVSRQVSHARSSSMQPRPVPIGARHHAESTSDPERAGEPELRRKLGEMTKKFEGLDTKYRNLREIGVKEAEVNFDKLKRHSEERNKIANDLIASLRQELTTTKQTADQAKVYRSDLQATQESLEATESRVTELMEALTTSQNEVKALQAKLAATRAATASVEPASAFGRATGAAANGKGPAARTMMGNAEAVMAAQVAQLKENMYSDLTGLIMRNVDRQDDGDIYDCIQTGRNGTLHFKLAVPNDAGTSYEEAEIQYIPRLDSNRDRDLLEILPDYLCDEISFSNSNAAKFYSRVVDTLTRKQVDE